MINPPKTLEEARKVRYGWMYDERYCVYEIIAKGWVRVSIPGSRQCSRKPGPDNLYCKGHLKKILLDEAKWILELEFNWDDEKSSGYSKDVLSKAILFAANHCGGNLPKITPGPDSSIDVHWRKEGLLANVPIGGVVSFYGEGAKGFTYHNKISQQIIEFLRHARMVDDELISEPDYGDFGEHI